MRDGIKQARSALRRGDADGALVLLWNELEPARLDGDGRSLRGIAELAARVAHGGDAGQQAEAQRLLEAVQRAGAAGDPTAVLGAEVQPGGYEPTFEPTFEPSEAEEAEAAGFRWGNLVWVLIFLAIVAVNVLGGTQE